MLQSVLDYIIRNKYILLIYLIIIVLIYINRKKFDVENGFIFLYRTDFGIKFMDRLANKNKEFWKLIGYSAIGVGFVGMITICALLVKGIYNLIFVPSAPATVGLVVPGVQIPGSEFVIPFTYGMVALFIVIVVHEFGHGVVARAHNLKIKNTGFGFMGPIPLAFVEPDEKQIVKRDSVTQHSMFAAGPFFNALLFVFAFILMIGFIAPVFTAMSTEGGVVFDKVQKDYPAKIAGVEKNVGYTHANGQPITGFEDFVNITTKLKPGDVLVLSNSKDSISITTTANPSDPEKAYIGVSGVQTYYVPKSQNLFYKGLHQIMFILLNLTQWVATLSLGIGLANLLPLGPVDGGRMFHRAAIDMKGKAKGVKIWGVVTIITLSVLLILVFSPIVKALYHAVLALF